MGTGKELSLVSGSYDQTLKIWDVASGTCQATLTGHSAQINGVKFSLDDTMLASGSGEIGRNDNSVRLCDVGTGRELKKLEGHSKDNKDCTCILGHRSQVNGVSFSADGSLVASCSGHHNGDYSVQMWSVETGQELKKFLGHSDRVRCVKFHPTHARLLVSGSDDQSVGLWDG